MFWLTRRVAIHFSRHFSSCSSVKQQPRSTVQQLNQKTQKTSFFRPHLALGPSITHSQVIIQLQPTIKDKLISNGNLHTTLVQPHWRQNVHIRRYFLTRLLLTFSPICCSGEGVGGAIVNYCFIESSHHLYKLFKSCLGWPHHTQVSYKIGQRFHYDQFLTKTELSVPEQMLGLVWAGTKH